MSDDVTIVTGGVAWGGWQGVEIMRGIETVPASFSLHGTERYPGDAGDTTVALKAGTPAQIRIGADTVITGYVEVTDRVVAPRQHEIAVAGRSKLADLVDCSGFTQQWQFNNLTLVSIAQAVCAPFGIAVSAPDGDSAAQPSVPIIVTETGFELLEEVARWSAKLLYDDTDGNLVIANVGSRAHASGVVEGQNAQAMRGTINVAERFTEIKAIWQDTAILEDGAGTTTIQAVDKADATDTTFPARADGQPRYRPLLIVSEQGPGMDQVVPRRIQWEMARRWGRSQVVRVTVDSWRDSAGTLWTPNWLVPVRLPSLKFADAMLLLVSVRYLRDEQGTRAELTLMPPEAMAPMPSVPFTYSAAYQEASGATTGAQTSPTPPGS